MTMKRILSLLLSFVLILPLVFVAVHAEETINDLTKIYNNLSNYLYKPYFTDSEYFESYEEMMKEIGELLKSGSITQAEIVKYYNELRTVYSQMMQDTFDYTSVRDLILSYEALPEHLFTPESWKKLLSIRDSAEGELEAPTLFYRKSNETKEAYAKRILENLSTYTADFEKAFAGLELVEAPEVMTKEYLADYAALVRFCAREEILGETESWDALKKALADADEAVELRNPRQTRLDEAFADITTHFAAVATQGYAFTKAKKALADYSVLKPDRYSEGSWARYEKEIQKLEEVLAGPHLFFIPFGADEKVCREYAERYMDDLAAGALAAKEKLVSMEDFQRLATLCQESKRRTAMEGLDLKLAMLQRRVTEGEEVLGDRGATAQQVQSAIQNIETASEDLTIAEGFLLQEQNRVVRQDSDTIRYTVILTAASLILSALFAVILSRYHYGKVNWTR